MATLIGRLIGDGTDTNGSGEDQRIAMKPFMAALSFYRQGKPGFTRVALRTSFTLSAAQITALDAWLDTLDPGGVNVGMTREFMEDVLYLGGEGLLTEAQIKGAAFLNV